MAEQILYKCHPAMFRNAPFQFVLCCLLVLVYGIGLLILAVWFLSAWGTTLTVSNERVTLRKGILSKHTNEVMIRDIRNVQISQGILQRLFSVGSIAIGSAGHGGVEIEAAGIPFPQRVKQIIDDRRRSASPG